MPLHEHATTVDLVPLSAPAKVISISAGVKVQRRDSKKKTPLKAGDDVNPRDEVVLPPRGSLVLDLGDGKSRTLRAPLDEEQSVTFVDSAELKNAR